jgi:hypothetical protein
MIVMQPSNRDAQVSYWDAQVFTEKPSHLSSLQRLLVECCP